MSRIKKRVRIGDILVSAGEISEEQLMEALAAQKESGNKLGRVLVEKGYIEEDRFLEFLSRQFEMPYIDLKQFNFVSEIVMRIPETMARRYRVLALREEPGGLLVGMADPMDLFAYDELARHLGHDPEVAVVRESELLNMLDLAYRRTGEINSFAEALQGELANEQFELASFSEDGEGSETPVARLMQSLLEDAVQIRASDVHIEPDEGVLRIRQRVDGVLQEHLINEARVSSALLSRLKLMAGLDISEKRLPQDGRFEAMIKGRQIDIRVSTLPVTHGESAVLRLLDQSGGVVSLDRVGMDLPLMERFRKLIHRPNGLILVTGPTGSGKTTTLYGALHELNEERRKIITAEDPVEYQLPRINQVQINSKVGLTFASVLRACLRQDPDVLLVGEIRDLETAEIALRASMTGHLVLSTLHTNDAISSSMRLLDIGVEGYLAASSLRGVLAQRLVRKNCDGCSTQADLLEGERVWLSSVVGEEAASTLQFQRGTGCARCNGTGFRGRVGVFEFLEFDDALADPLRRNDAQGFAEAARCQPGYEPLLAGALNFASQGLTAVSEVIALAGAVEETRIGDAGMTAKLLEHNAVMLEAIPAQVRAAGASR